MCYFESDLTFKFHCLHSLRRNIPDHGDKLGAIKNVSGLNLCFLKIAVCVNSLPTKGYLWSKFKAIM